MATALHTIAKCLAVFAAATAVAYGAVRLADRPGDAAPLPAGVTSTGWPDDLPPPQPTVTAPAVGHLALRAGLVVGGNVRSVSSAQPVALADGQRFRVWLRTDARSHVELHAIAPDGRSSGRALWRATLASGRVAVSPSLHLTGMSGLETLVVRARSADGVAFQEHRIHILHDARTGA